MQVLKRNQVPFLPYIADWQEEVEEHRQLIDTLERGDPETMAAEMDRHLEHSEQYRLDLLEYQSRNGSIVMKRQVIRRTLHVENVAHADTAVA